MRTGYLPAALLAALLGAVETGHAQVSAVVIEYDLVENCIPEGPQAIRATEATFARNGVNDHWFDAGSDVALFPVVKFVLHPGPGGYRWTIIRKEVLQQPFLPDSLELAGNPYLQRVNELSAPLVDRQTWSYSIRAHGHANCADRTVDPQIVFNGGGGTPQWGPSQKLVAALAILFALTTLWLLWKPPGRRTGHA